MGGKQSTTTSNPARVTTGSGEPTGASGATAAATSGGLSSLLAGAHHSSGSSDARLRARSLSSVLNLHPGQPLSIPASQSGFGTPESPTESGSSTPDSSPFGRVFAAHSLPVQLVSFNGIKCPVCSKFVLPDDVECHLVMCLTKPRISYNDDVLTEDKGECVICLEELAQGDTIARLPCLCIYHKRCIDAWFEVNRSCPEHPLD
ncbi:E3 ubiquitin-protein ligase ZNRF1 [Haemaphysalis longicornis]